MITNYILLLGMPGGGELFFIVLVIIMLFGSKKIPELARGLGKGMREIKNATGDIQREIREGAKDINSVKSNVNVERQVKDLLKKESAAAPDQQPEQPEEQKPTDQTVQRRSPYSTGTQTPTDNS